MFYINTTKETESRYDMSLFMEFSDVYDILTSYFMDKVIELPVYGERVVQGEEGKPDLLSYKIYGSTRYWWILMVYNAILDNSDIINGLIVKYPSLDDIEDLYFKLKSFERTKNIGS